MNKINNDISGELSLKQDYNYDSDKDSSLTSGIEITKSLTIDGNGHILDAKGLTNIFNFNDETGSQDLILKNDPDVLMLQEVSIDWIPYLQSFMQDNGYSYYGYGRYGGELSGSELQSGDQFTPVLWKTDKYDLKDSGHFWLSSTPEVYSAAWIDGTVSKFPRCVNWVILQDKETGGEFMAICVHTDPENDVVRTNSSQLIVEKANEIANGIPVVMAGDWNMSITDKAYLTVAENGYPDVRFVAEETTYGGSFNAWGERTDDNYAFGDHVFISNNMGAKSFEVVNDYYDGVHISDHNPLLAELYY